MLYAEPHQPVRYFRFPESSVKTICEFIEIFLQVAVADAMIGSEQKALEVTDHNMHPRQLLAGLFRRRDLTDVMMLFRQDVERRQCIGPDRYSGGDSPLGEIAHPIMIHRGYGFNGSEARSALKSLTGNKDSHLSFGAASALFRPFAPNECIVQFDDVAEAIEGVAVAHGLAQLTQHGKGCWPTDSDKFGQSQCGKAAFVGGDPVDGPEPFGQGQFGSVEQGTGSYRSLEATAGTFVELARLQEATMIE